MMYGKITIDVERLRDDMRDEYYAGSFAGNPAMIVEAFDIGNMTPEQLVQYAIREGVDLQQYVIED